MASSSSSQDEKTPKFDPNKFNISKANDEEITEFIRNRVENYKVNSEWKNETLWEYFQEDFEGFTISNFETSKDGIRHLRDHLRKNGINIPGGKGYKISKALFELLQEDEPHVLGATSITSVIASPPNIVPPIRTGRELTELSKIYRDDMKYGGSEDRLDYMLSIFYSLCLRANVRPDQYVLAASIMLKKSALQYYFMAIDPHLTSSSTFDEIVTKLRNNFEGSEHKQMIFQMWGNTTLKSIMTKNPGRTVLQNLETLIDELRDLQLGLKPAFRNEDYLHAKLFEACRGVPACRSARYRPSSTLQGLIDDLRSSIMAYEDESDIKEETFFTDRRFHKDRPRQDYRQSRRQDFRGKSQGNKRCFICKKEGCWSTKHSRKERDDHKEIQRSQWERRYDQYLADDKTNKGINLETDSEEEEIEALLHSSNLLDESSENSVDNCETYFTTFGEINGPEMLTSLANQATYHAITKEDSDAQQDPFTYTTNDPKKSNRYTQDEFYGILVDTGAAGYSTAGYGQYLASQKFLNNDEGKLDTSKAGRITVQFGIGSKSSIGTTTLRTPIGMIEFHVVEADTPFLLSLSDMDRLGIVVDNLNNVLVQSNKAYTITRRFGHLFFVYHTPYETSFNCFLTEKELRQLHRRFGHPSIDRFYNLLRQSNHDVNREAIQKLTKYCSTCQKHGGSPRRFKFTLRDDTIDFNHSIYVDVMYIESRPLLHVVDEATRFQAARWLSNISSLTTWNTLRLCWIDVYVGPPDMITHDAGTNFVGHEFQQYATSLNIKTKSVPVEAPNSMGIVERYHAPLRRAFQVISQDLPEQNKDLTLQMAVKAINDTAGPDGLVPTLLVFGCYPRMAQSDPPSPTIAARASALRKAMAEVSKLRASRQVTDALRQRNGPQTDSIRDLPINSEVLVWRDNNNQQRWDGPFKLLSTINETCTVQLNSGPTEFRITSVKPYLRQSSEELHPSSTQSIDPVTPPVSERRNPIRNRQLPARFRANNQSTECFQAYVFLVQTPWTSQFKESRRKELHDLIERDVFKIVDEEEAPVGQRIFGSRWVDVIKNEGTPMAFAKSRLVVQAFKDEGKSNILTQSPTIQRVSQRIILSIAASTLDNDDEPTSLYLRDITQAYVQSTTNINRTFFVHPPPELESNNKLLKIEKPLYGIPEAGNHWFKTYHSHHVNNLDMKPSTYDNCLLHTYSNSHEFGLIGLQTDDTLILANQKFANKEEAKLNFDSKPRIKLSLNDPLTFNGSVITLTENMSLHVTQEKHCDKIVTLQGPTTSKDQYITQRARGAYISTVCQPEASFDLSSAAQVINPNKIDAAKLNRRLEWQRKNRDRGLKFIKLHLQSLQLVVFTDSSFANNRDFSSQIGFVIALVDKYNKANIIHWQSVKCKRVTRSVLASELYAMALGFDHGSPLKTTLDAILNQSIPLVICTDSRSLFDCLVKLGTTYEKRLMIDLMCLREAYEKREIAEIRWIDGMTNPADSMTKEKPSDALKKLIDTNHINIEAREWVERSSKISSFA